MSQKFLKMPPIQTVSKAMVRGWIGRRKADSHKGDYGHVLIIAGSRGMSGAAVLSACGALRGGAGCVAVAVPKSQQPIVATKIRLEAMTLALPETRAGSLAAPSVPLLLNYIEKRRITSLAMGPGLSRNSETKFFVKRFLTALNKKKSSVQAIVLDADAFLALKPDRCGTALFHALGLPMIVTPHAGELANFCDMEIGEVQKNRIEFAQKFAKLNRVVCVLKGHETVMTDGNRIFLNATGNPGMATGGSGDVLTGLIAALIPQIVRSSEFGVRSKRSFKLATHNSQLSTHNSQLLHAACIGVYIHGLAGDLAKKEKTEIAMLAGDLAEKIPQAFKKILK